MVSVVVHHEDVAGCCALDLHSAFRAVKVLENLGRSLEVYSADISSCYGRQCVQDVVPAAHGQLKPSEFLAAVRDSAGDSSAVRLLDVVSSPVVILSPAVAQNLSACLAAEFIDP